MVDAGARQARFQKSQIWDTFVVNLGINEGIAGDVFASQMQPP